MTNKIILSLDSSTIRASVAISRGSTILSEVFITRQKSYSEQMHTAIEEVLVISQLQFSDIDAIAVTHGPGSFTGLRVAGNIAKTFSYLLGIPLLSISTLEALALQSTAMPVLKKNICVMINAFRQMVFLALYDRNESGKLIVRIEPGLFSLDQLDSVIIERVECIGDAYDYYKDEISKPMVERLGRINESKDYPLPKSIVSLAVAKLNTKQTIEWNQFAPLYLKPSEAEENLRKGLLNIRRLT